MVDICLSLKTNSAELFDNGKNNCLFFSDCLVNVLQTAENGNVSCED